MLKITWLGQGGYMLCDGKTSLCIDQYLSDGVFKTSGKERLVSPSFEMQVGREYGIAEIVGAK